MLHVEEGQGIISIVGHRVRQVLDMGHNQEVGGLLGYDNI